MIFVTKTKLYGIMPIDVQLSNVITTPASENPLYLYYLHCMIYIYNITCNLNRKIAIPIIQRNINGILTRSSFKLSQSEVLSPTRILYHFRIVQNKYSIIRNCYDYFNSRIFLKLNISPSYFCAVRPFLIERYLIFTLSDEKFNQLVNISHPGQFERATNNSKYLYWLIYSIRFYFATVCHLIWVKI